MKNLVIVFCLLPLSLFSQSNTVYATGGSIAFAHSLNLSYEHKLSGGTEISGLYAKAMLGNIWTVNFFRDTDEDFTSRFNYMLGAGYLFGKGHNALELGLGFGNAADDEQSISYLHACLGYRCQSTSMVFRTGLSFAEGLYLSYGFRF